MVNTWRIALSNKDVDILKEVGKVYHAHYFSHYKRLEKVPTKGGQNAVNR